MKIISNLLESIEGIQNWYIAGLLIFFIMFIVFVVRILLKQRSEVDEYKKMVLDDDQNEKIKIENINSEP